MIQFDGHWMTRCEPGTVVDDNVTDFFYVHQKKHSLLNDSIIKPVLECTSYRIRCVHHPIMS